MNSFANANRKRTTKSETYNCFGYALRRKEWLQVRQSGVTYAEWPTAEHVHREFNLKPVVRSEMTLGKEYIAYRYYSGDFHFCRRDKKGHWRHKQGAYTAQAISQKDVFARTWPRSDGYHYNSKIYLFEILT